MEYETEKTTKKIVDRRGRPTLYPFEEMEVGFNFFIEQKRSSQMSPICAYWNKKLAPKRFIARHLTADGQRELKAGKVGCRIHRVR